MKATASAPRISEQPAITIIMYCGASSSAEPMAERIHQPAIPIIM